MASRKAFVLERFFDGPVSGWGFTHSRLGKLQNHFTIDAEGKWDPALKKLELVEAYTFSDGHKDTLRWEIDKNAPHRYIGTESRLKGRALGEQSGQSFRWRYRRLVPAGNGSSTKLSFDDCFLSQDENVVIATAAVSKFGIQIATITAFYLKRQ